MMASSTSSVYQHALRNSKPRRTFNPKKTRRYGKPTFLPDYLVKYSPKWGYSRLFNFPYVGAHYQPRMNTIVIQIQGIATPNNPADPNARAAVGVYFGPNCVHNTGFCLPPEMKQTNHRAILEATRTALNKIIAMRITILDSRWKEVIIMTNSDYLKESLSKWVWTWEKNGWHHMGQKTIIENVKAMQEVHGMLVHMENMLNMSVRFWKVDREYISGADQLTQSALAQTA